MSASILRPSWRPDNHQLSGGTDYEIWGIYCVLDPRLPIDSVAFAVLRQRTIIRAGYFHKFVNSSFVSPLSWLRVSCVSLTAAVNVG